MGIDEVAAACFPVWQLDAEGATRLAWAGGSRGRDPVRRWPGRPGLPDGQFLALATDDAGTARYVAVFA